MRLTLVGEVPDFPAEIDSHQLATRSTNQPNAKPASDTLGPSRPWPLGPDNASEHAAEEARVCERRSRKTRRGLNASSP